MHSIWSHLKPPYSTSRWAMNRRNGSNNGGSPTADKAAYVACAIRDKVIKGWRDSKAIPVVSLEDELLLSLGCSSSFAVRMKLETTPSLRAVMSPRRHPDSALFDTIESYTLESIVYRSEVPHTPNILVPTRMHTNRWSSEIVGASPSYKYGIWASIQAGKYLSVSIEPIPHHTARIVIHIVKCDHSQNSKPTTGIQRRNRLKSLVAIYHWPKVFGMSTFQVV